MSNLTASRCPAGSRLWRSTCTGLLILIATLAFLLPAVHADEAVSMQATAGFDGRGRPGSWVPVVVDVQNDGPDLAAELQVVDPIPVSTGARPYSSHYVAEVVLPRGARKRFTVYVPIGSSGTLPLRLVAADQTLAEVDVTLRLSGQRELLVGILSRRPGALSSLSALSPQGSGQQIIPVRLQPRDVPPLSEALDNFAFLVLADFESAELAPEQTAALEAWVAGGGALFVAGGPEWRRTIAGLPASLRPVDVQGTAELDGAPALGELSGSMAPKDSVVIARGNLQSGRPLVVQDGMPLVVAAPVGAGTVVFLAFDPALDPLASWSGSLALWQELLARALSPTVLAPAVQGGPQPMYGRGPAAMTGALNNLPALDLPPTELLLGLLGGYVLIVGPLNYLVLRRLRRPALAWLTVPACALLFGAGTYFTALQGKGGTVLTHAISVVHLSPDGGPQQVESYIGLLSPAETSYRLTVASDGLVSALGTPYGANSAVDAPAGIRIRREAGSSVVDFVGMEMWTMRGVAIEERRAGRDEIGADLRLQGGKLAGSVTNRTAWPLRDVVLIAGSSFQRLGDLAVGATAAVDLVLAAPSFVPKGMPPVLYQAYAPPPTHVGTVASPGSPPPAAQPPALSERERIRRQQILTDIFNQAGGGQEIDPVTLVGWAEDAPVAFQVQGQSPRTVQTTVVVAPLHPSFPDAFQLPAGFIPAKALGVDGGDLAWTPAGLHFTEGSVTVQFALPASAQADEIAIEVPTNGAPSSAVPVEAHLYNWSTRQWDAMPLVPARPATASTPSPGARSPRPAATAVAIPMPPSAIYPPGYAQSLGYLLVRQGSAAVAPYVDPDGLLRLKLTKVGRDALGIVLPSLAVSGRGGG